MAERKRLPGKFVWFELVSKDAKKAQAFYGEVLGWRVQPFPMEELAYEMILTGESLDTMIGGYAPARGDQTSHWLSYVSVEDVDATARAVGGNGGRIVDPPSELPGVGRWARVADPQGAELCLFRAANGDAPDREATQGQFFWNELHTNDAPRALAFYEKILGFTHETMNGPAGPYYVLSRSGTGRGGITGECPRTGP